jgi:hypothetical protein
MASKGYSKLVSILGSKLYEPFIKSCSHAKCSSFHIDYFMNAVRTKWPSFEGHDAEMRYKINRLMQERLNHFLKMKSEAEFHEEILKLSAAMKVLISETNVTEIESRYKTTELWSTAAAIRSLVEDISAEKKADAERKLSQLTDVHSPGDAVTLLDLDKTAKRLHQGGSLLPAKQIQANISARIASLTRSGLLVPDENNLARNLAGSKYDAFAVVGNPKADQLSLLPVVKIGSPVKSRRSERYDSYDYLLAKAPKDIYETGDLLSLVAGEGIGLMISCYEDGEKGRVAYWDGPALSSAPLRGGLQYEGSIYNSHTVSSTSEAKSKPGVPKIGVTERTIIMSRPVAQATAAFRGTADYQPAFAVYKEADIPDVATVKREKVVIKHLHVTGWPDTKLHPDPKAVDFCLDRIDELGGVPPPNPPTADCKSTSSADTPSADSKVVASSRGFPRFMLGCRNSRGRSGTILICHQLRCQIREQLAAGMPLDSISINIPNTVYKLRLQREDFLHHSHQFISIYEITDRFYQKLKAAAATSTAAPIADKPSLTAAVEATSSSPLASDVVVTA